MSAQPRSQDFAPIAQPRSLWKHLEKPITGILLTIALSLTATQFQTSSAPASDSPAFTLMNTAPLARATLFSPSAE